STVRLRYPAARPYSPLVWVNRPSEKVADVSSGTSLRSMAIASARCPISSVRSESPEYHARWARTARAQPCRRWSPAAAAMDSAWRAWPILLASSPNGTNRAAGVEVEVAGLLCPLTTLRKVPERVERLLQAGHSLPVG